MISALKMRLKPTKEQQQLMVKSAGCARFAYNFMLTYCSEYYEVGEKKTPTNARDILTQIKHETYPFLEETSADAWRNTSRDLTQAFKNFFEGRAEYPQKKTRKNKKAFFHDNRKLEFTETHVRLEKIGWVKYISDQNPPLGSYKKLGIKVSNPRISNDNLHWHLTFGIEQETEKLKPTDLELGIDLGLKDLATLSTGEKIANINHSEKVKRLKKRHKRLSKQISRKYENNKEEIKEDDKAETEQDDTKKPRLPNGQAKYRYVKTNNIKKLEHERRLIERKLTNIRNNHIHTFTKQVCLRKPSKVVLEDLNVSGMLRNKHLSKAIQECKWYEIRRQLGYKLLKYLGIELTLADRFFASSKKCSCCGYKYNQHDYNNIPWNLKIREWTCAKCGTTHDRDINAAINLANYLPVRQTGVVGA